MPLMAPVAYPMGVWGYVIDAFMTSLGVGPGQVAIEIPSGRPRCPSLEAYQPLHTMTRPLAFSDHTTRFYEPLDGVTSSSSYIGCYGLCDSYVLIFAFPSP